jgi:oxygen-independent coproporphyrinogen-3 oxidase
VEAFTGVAGSPGEPGPVESVYVHAPFCARRCFYCDFAVQVRKTGDVEAWLSALEGELRALEGEGRFELAPTLATLYVGGGTPSLLGPSAMDGLADVLERGRLTRSDLEWTGEANPESFTPRVAAAWRAAGVTRVSLGLQTFHEPSLRWMGRLHGAEGGRRAVQIARDAGFDAVSVDLIFGLPSHLGRSWERDLDTVLELEVPHVSLYGLTVEPGTPLGRAVADDREAVADESRYGAEYMEAVRRLRAAGFHHYEVSNFGRPGFECRHNAAYWGGGSYLGLGNGAHSYLHPLRRWNLRDWDAYRKGVDQGRLPVAGSELLGVREHRLEHLWLALRTRRGVAHEALDPRARETVRGWIDRGLADDLEGIARLTPSGWLVMDRLTVELADVLEGAGSAGPPGEDPG